MSEELCKTCPYESLIEELQRDAERNSKQHNEFYQKFSSHEKAIAISEERYNNLLSCMNEIKQTLGNLSNTVNEIKMKPASRWDNLVNYLVSAIIGAIVCFIATQIGM